MTTVQLTYTVSSQTQAGNERAHFNGAMYDTNKEVTLVIEEQTNDTGLKINIYKIKYINTSKHKHKNMQPKTKNIKKDIKKYQNFNICVHR
jgi:16S rRNA C1402 (ribose-2'-O) methylase RsmI